MNKPFAKSSRNQDELAFAELNGKRTTQMRQVKVAAAVSMVLFATSVSAIFWDDLEQKDSKQNQAESTVPPVASDYLSEGNPSNPRINPVSLTKAEAVKHQPSKQADSAIQDSSPHVDLAVAENQPTFKTVEASAQPIMQHRTFLFRSGQSQLSLEQQHALQAWVQEQITVYKPIAIKVEGYSDPTGSRASNLALSANRANNVKMVLEDYLQLQSDLVTAEGKGETKLFNPLNLADNRRVVVTIEMESEASMDHDQLALQK